MSYYDFVKVDSTKRKCRSCDSRASIKNIHEIEVKFRSISEIHVGSGRKRFQDGKIFLRHIKDSNGFPIIPASSFKGAVSTVFLALSGDSNLTSNLFGAPGYQSKVFFHDIRPSNSNTVFKEVLRQWKPKKSKNNLVKFYVRKAPKTNPFGLLECIPKDAILTGKIIGHNLSDIELGGLICSLGYGFKDATFKIGYAKPQGFGQMVIDLLKVYRINFSGFKIEKREEEFNALVGKFREYVKRKGEDLDLKAKIVFSRVT